MKRIALALMADGGGRLSRRRADGLARPARQMDRAVPAGRLDRHAGPAGQPQTRERLKQTVIVENKAGAGGNLGTDYAVKQPADGYTIVMGNIGPISINPALYPDLPYKPQRDLAPVTMLMSVPNLLVVNPALPVKSVKELIDYARRAGAPLAMPRRAPALRCTWPANCSPAPPASA